MCNCKTQCTLVVLVTAASTSVALPETNRLTNGIIKGIGMRRLNGVAAKAYTGQTLTPDAVVASAHLSLNNTNGTQILQLPLQYLQRDFNSPEWMKVNDLRNIDLTQSTITLDIGAAGWAATQVFELTFEVECDNCGIPTKTTR